VPAGRREDEPGPSRRRARTRARLLEAAFAVFAAKGFGRVSIEEVCTAAGFSRGAFYSNFASLDELFFALYEERADLITAQVTSALADGAGDGDDLARRIERVTDVLLMERDWLLVKTDFLVRAARDPQAARELLGHRRRLRDVIARQLDEWFAGRLPEGPGDAGAAADAVIAAYDGVTVQLLLDGDTGRARQRLGQLLHTLLAPRAGTGPDDR